MFIQYYLLTGLSNVVTGNNKGNRKSAVLYLLCIVVKVSIRSRFLVT